MVEDEDVSHENVGNAESARRQWSFQREAERFTVEGDGTTDDFGDWFVLVVLDDRWVLNSVRPCVNSLEATSVLLSAGNDVTS